VRKPTKAAIGSYSGYAVSAAPVGQPGVYVFAGVAHGRDLDVVLRSNASSSLPSDVHALEGSVAGLSYRPSVR